VRWRNPLLALLAAAAVAGVAIGFSVGGGDGGGGSKAPGSSSGSAPTEVAGASETALTADTGGTTVDDLTATRFGHRLLVGTADDVFRQADPATAARLIRTAHEAGFDAVLVSSLWTPGRRTLAAAERLTLRNVVTAAGAEGLRVFVFVWHGFSGTTPRTPRARQQFAAYAASIARAFPQIRDVIVGNEPNLNTFWMPQFGPGGSDAAAKGYLDLLAQAYDALKAVSPRVQVIGGALAPRGSDRPRLKRDTHSPTQFIRDLGAAYKASGRTTPIMDAFAIHPYMRTSAFPPSDTHAASTTITIGDYPKLTALLRQAFAGTAQRGRGLPVYYTEFGVQTKVPAAHRHAYTDLGSPAAVDAVDPKTQARYYREALSLAACQPTVRGLFVFHTFDEADLKGWQSGLYYADQKPKPSLPAFRTAAASARAARLTRCAGGTFVRKE
jgi:hypothetical protein